MDTPQNVAPEGAPPASAVNTPRSDFRPRFSRPLPKLIAFGCILVMVVVFIVWRFNAATMEEVAHLKEEEAVSVLEGEPELPGEFDEEEEHHSGVYNFFYVMFAGMREGLEDNPHNLKNVEHLDNYNLETDELFVPNQDETAVAQKETQEEEQRFSGKILDYEGNVAGDVDAISYNDGEVEGFHFVLKEGLTPAGKARRYSIPKDEVKIVEDEDVLYIQLTKEQTEHLAEMLYSDEE